MNQSNFVLVIMLVFCAICASKSIMDAKKKSSQTLARLIVDEEVQPIANENDSDNTQKHRKCEELPEIILADLLGEAYNSRYMSINWPVDDEEVRSDYVNADGRNAYTISKRKVESLPSFYVEENHSIALSEKPAWDVRGHSEDFDAQLSKNRRRKRAISIIDDRKQLQSENGAKTENIKTNETAVSGSDSMTMRNKRAYGRRNGAMSFGGQQTYDSNKKLYPWKCDSSIKWVDLGPDFFPRFLRTVECTKHYCWYKAFVCKPKSFAVKVLHRRKGMCADAGNLRKISPFNFRGEFGELWKWEEVAINFCCDCAIA